MVVMDKWSGNTKTKKDSVHVEYDISTIHEQNYEHKRATKNLTIFFKQTKNLKEVLLSCHPQDYMKTKEVWKVFVVVKLAKVF